ncbi:MAG: DEAD/DEAH box helicase family protein [Candidatus Competibacteraceae bacterium]|nr:DEAD/DEAH box helicase family protein [Candidatus Competibacteraceae bacterium]
MSRYKKSASTPARQEIPIQPVARPILCGPFAEPDRHWVYDTQTGEARQEAGRRPASYWYKTQRTGSAQLALLAEEERDDLPLVNLLREDVKRWREANYRNATPVTRQLLLHWSRADRSRRLFFCQREAVETVIYLNEILAAGKNPGFKLKLPPDDFRALTESDKPSFVLEREPKVFPTLVDRPNETGLPPLRRHGCKMATGSGKTVVMAMLIVWTFCNRGRAPSDERFPQAVLVVCPNLTIHERLQVLRADREDNYYQTFDLVPASLMPELRKGKLMIVNWHKFAPESPHVESGKSYAVVDKGEEGADAFARRVLGNLYDRAPLMVLNDEAHHAYRPKLLVGTEKLSAEEKAEREEATVWIAGLDRIHQACGIRFVIDLSATPFYLAGSGYIEGSPFPWLVSDFGLVDAIESGIVKIPRLPVSDTTGRPEPKFFRLWQAIAAGLQPGEKLPGGKPKPDVVWREAQAALITLASQWKERFEYQLAARPGQDRVPPVLIIVADNTHIAELFYRKISGEETVDSVEVDEDADEESTAKKPKAKTRTVFGAGQLFPELFANREDFRPTLRIDSKLLAEAELEDAKTSRKEAAETLRRIVDTVGKPGQPGEQVRCVVSVQMLTEGWDASNVTHILGLRAFGSQLLCEQVVGRGLRRMDYTVDPTTGLLTEEYVDIYGVPFSVIPFRGRSASAPAPEDKPKNHVRADDARRHYEIRFPIVEGYAFALRKNAIKVDIAAIEKLVLAPDATPTAVFVKPQVGYQLGNLSVAGGFDTATQDRQAYYANNHPQTIRFEIARLVTAALTEGIEGASPKLKLQGRHQLFPQVYRIVDEYIARKVDFRGCHPCELGLEVYMRRLVERLTAAIEPDAASGESPLLPRLNRHKPIGSTAEVNFKTTRPCVPTIRSHIDQVVADTDSWEQAAVFRLEQARDLVAFYARNDHLELSIPYEYLGVTHAYFPDFVVRLSNEVTLLLEIKGEEREQDRAKHQAARRWASAVNYWGQLGRWAFHACKDPQRVIDEIRVLSG